MEILPTKEGIDVTMKKKEEEKEYQCPKCLTSWKEGGPYCSRCKEHGIILVRKKKEGLKKGFY